MMRWEGEEWRSQLGYETNLMRLKTIFRILCGKTSRIRMAPQMESMRATKRDSIWGHDRLLNMSKF
jgi:hypothetical protein